MKNIIKNSLSPSQKVVSPQGIKKAKQEFKDDADINSIMRKFQKTGVITHTARHQGEYGEIGPQTLHDALNTVRAAETMFQELPSSIRNKFANNPQEFLAYVQDSKNYIEAQSLGLRLAPEAENAALAAIEANKAVQTPVAAATNTPSPSEGDKVKEA